MSYLSSKVPVLKDGLAREIVQKLLLQVKKQKGLTSFIQNHGIHGRYLKEEEPMDIPVSKLFKILQHKAQYQSDDEFFEDWNSAGREFLSRVRGMKSLEFRV